MNGLGDQSLPDAIRLAFKCAKHPLTKIEVRKWLTDRGYPEKRFGNNRAYFYTTMGRLERRGEINEVRGSRYAAPRKTPGDVSPGVSNEH